MQRRERRTDVVDELQGLRHDRAVERVARDLRRVGEVADDRRLRVALLRHEDVDARDVCAVARRVVGRRDLEDAPPDVGGALADEPIHEDAVDRRSPLVAPVRIDRRRPAQRAEVERPAAPPVDVGSPHGAQPASHRLRDDSSHVDQGGDDSGRGRTAPGRPHRRGVPALRRRRALARRLDRLLVYEPARPSCSSRYSAATPTRRHRRGAGIGVAASGRRANPPVPGARRTAWHARCWARRPSRFRSGASTTSATGMTRDGAGGRDAPAVTAPASCSFRDHRSPTRITTGSRRVARRRPRRPPSGSTPSSRTRSGPAASRMCPLGRPGLG